MTTSGVPVAIGAPRSKTTMWSQRLMMSSMLCSTMRKVVPSSLSSRTSTAMRSMRDGFTPPAGSSSMTNGGSDMRVDPSSSSFCCP